jgi:oligoendopeptidase F
MAVYETGAWDLSPLLPEGIEKAKKEVEQKTAAFEKHKSKLTNSTDAKTFLAITEESIVLERQLSRLKGFVDLKFTENTADQEASARSSFLESFCTDIDNRTRFFTHWFKDLPDAKAKELIAAAGPHQKFFSRIRENAKFILPEKEERIISIKDTSGANALETVYEVLTNGLKFPFNGKELARDQLARYTQDPSPDVREQAYRTLFGTYAPHKPVLSEIYRALVTSWSDEAIKLRGYKQPIQPRNVGNDLPDAAVDALLRVCERNNKLFHRFFKAKQQRLKLAKMRRFDVYAPIATERPSVSFNEAVTLMLDSFGAFSTEFRDHAKQMLDQKRVHSQVQPNKRSGAFCASRTNDQMPYVLLNYSNTFEDATTLAHELGHAVHFILAGKKSFLTFMPGLPVAETASTFAETLVIERTMALHPERAEQLTFKLLDDAYASIIRQAGFVSFEKKAHDLIAKGASAPELDKVYFDDLKKQLGPGIETDELFKNEWNIIPHIHVSPFYCYAYAFGKLMAYALYEQFRKDGQKAVPGIMEFFAAGGSKAPVDMANALGADITSEKFWQQGFDFLEQMLKKIEK